MNFENLYTPKEVAALWRVSRRTVYEWIKTGRVKAYKLGDTVRVPESELTQFLKPIEPQLPAPSKSKPAKRATRKRAVRRQRS
jgi:putative molybdopterin biosynthesis protein